MGQRQGPQQLFNPNQPRGPPVNHQADQQSRQIHYLEQVAASEIGKAEMSPMEYQEKESFRLALEQVCHEVCDADPERLPKISLEPFGSFKSGFATAGSDMDLVIVVEGNGPASACFSLLEDDLPRALERRLLQVGYGARLLTRTRVPIIKICQSPDSSFLDKLREEREKWDLLDNEKKYPHLYPHEDGDGDESAGKLVEVSTVEKLPDREDPVKAEQNGEAETNGATTDSDVQINGMTVVTTEGESMTLQQTVEAESGAHPQTKRPDAKPWTRERKAGPLDFPKSGVGIQSDINFFNPLGLHNTQLLRCYCLCDPRVRPMVLFVKAWAKRRKINSSYSGTLSSYGYVLMALHYLVNVANPPVLPNLQAPWTPLGNCLGEGEVVDGWNVSFWRSEEQIGTAAQSGHLTNNRETLGSLLAGFFQYYSSLGGGVTFRWMQEVLSLRSQGGLLTKEDKGWVKAVTEEGEGKKIQHRYLFCIEDPFELNHNVARTVTHNGIVAIRDEFRRARRILQAIGNGLFPKDGELFADLIEVEDLRKATGELKANGLQDGSSDVSIEQDASKAESTPPKVMHQVNPGIKHHQNASGAQTHANARSNRKSGSTKMPQMRDLDIHDNNAFPSLSPAKPSKKKLSQAHNPNDEFSEISGDKAKALLEEVKRKKDEAQAESTATGAAEAVLGDSD